MQQVIKPPPSNSVMQAGEQSRKPGRLQTRGTQCCWVSKWSSRTEWTHPSSLTAKSIPLDQRLKRITANASTAHMPAVFHSQVELSIGRQLFFSGKETERYVTCPWSHSQEAGCCVACFHSLPQVTAQGWFHSSQGLGGPHPSPNTGRARPGGSGYCTSL